MTLYTVSITVPANTPDKKPVRRRIRLEGDVITRVGVHFPPGPACMVRVWVTYGRLRIWPVGPDKWVVGDNVTIWDDFYHELPFEPYPITVNASSPGTGYSHTITVYISVVRREEVPLQREVVELNENIKRLLELLGVVV